MSLRWNKNWRRPWSIGRPGLRGSVKSGRSCSVRRLIRLSGRWRSIVLKGGCWWCESGTSTKWPWPLTKPSTNPPPNMACANNSKPNKAWTNSTNNYSEHNANTRNSPKKESNFNANENSSKKRSMSSEWSTRRKESKSFIWSMIRRKICRCFFRGSGTIRPSWQRLKRESKGAPV